MNSSQWQWSPWRSGLASFAARQATAFARGIHTRGFSLGGTHPNALLFLQSFNFLLKDVDSDFKNNQWVEKAQSGRQKMREMGTGAILRWMVHPAALSHLEYVDGDWPWEHAPQENQVITRQFLVDPISKRPVSVWVVRVLRLDKEIPIVFAILVKRAD